VTSRFRLDINVQTKKSQSRLRNLSRSENFIISRQFVSISIEKCVDFCIFSSRFLNPLRLFIIFRLKRPRQCRDFSTNLDCVSTTLDNLDASWQISTIWTGLAISTKILTRQSLDWKVSILKISTEKKKVDLDMMDSLDGLKKFVSTRRTFSISISIGLDCRDPHA
jgi:hypothetical protein